MDHAQPTNTASTPKHKNLHRGALKEIQLDRLVNRPQHEAMPKRSKAFLSKDLSPLNVPSLPAQFHSEPRSRRRRSVSGDISPRKKLFEDESEEDSLLLLSSQQEAFVLKTDLRRRRKTSPSRTNNETNAQRAALMESIRTSAVQRRLRRPRDKWVIPMDHPFKAVWDIVTVCLSILNAYTMHVSIRERNYDVSPLLVFCEVWFFLDILLNFFTENKTANGETLNDYRSIWARYLTSWFAVDLLALVPWEMHYVKPIVDLQKRRGFFTRSFFRSKAVVRVTRHLRGRHFRLFGTVARRTKQHGVGASRLLRMIIKYVPKYVLFLRNMKGIVAFRVLRQFHWFRRFYKGITVSDEKSDGMTGSITRDDFDEFSNGTSKDGNRRASAKSNSRVQIVYEPWETMDDDDDGVPL